MSNIMILLLLTLALAAFLAFDLKMAWEFFHDSPEAHEEDGTFLLWWARKNVVKFIVTGGVYLLLALILLMPEFTLFLRTFKLELKHPALVVITLALVGYIIYDLKTARRYYRDNLVLSTGEIPFLRWWMRVNVVKFTVLGSVLLLILSGPFLAERFQLFRDKSESSGFITNAARYFQEQRYREAALEFRNALQVNSEDTGAHLGLARSLLRLGFAEEAVQSYRKAVELDPKLYTAHLELGRLAYATGSVDLALQEATTASHLKPDKPEPRLLLALIYRRTGQDNLAGEQYRAILGKNPADRETRHLLITMLQTKRRYVEAAREAEAGLAVSPGQHRSAGCSGQSP